MTKLVAKRQKSYANFPPFFLYKKKNEMPNYIHSIIVRGDAASESIIIKGSTQF